MPGLRTMLTGGFALVAAGMLLTALMYRYGNRIGVAVFAAITLLGIAGVVAGLMRHHRERGTNVPDRHRSALDIDLLVRSMVAVAASDTHLDEGEMCMIEDVSAGLLGDKIPRSKIERVVNQIEGRNYLDQIARMARQASREGVDLAVKGAVWAGRADGALSDEEERLVAAIAAALGVSGHRLRQCIAEADHVYERLAAHDVKKVP